MTNYGEEMAETKTEEVTVPPKATRRVLAPSYKARILQEYERLPNGEKGELLRREGLFSSQMLQWRKALEKRNAQVLSTKRGPKVPVDRGRIKQLERENTRLSTELAQAR